MYFAQPKWKVLEEGEFKGEMIDRGVQAFSHIIKTLVGDEN